MTRPALTLSLLLFPALLLACTGTEEPLQNVRLALLTDGGKTLGYTDTTSDPIQPTVPTLQTVQTFDAPAVSLLNFNIGSNVALTLPDHVEQRDVNLANTLSFGSLPFDPKCLTQSAMDAARDRLLTLSDCNGVQQVALYRIDRTLVWRAQLPTPPIPIPNVDNPPTRLAVLGDSGLISRVSLTGQSEVIRVTPRNSGDPIQDQIALVSDPLQTVSIRDLAPYRSGIYAATDTGVRPVLATGAPDTSITTGSVAAFGNSRVDRLWSNNIGSRVVLAAWRNNFSSGNSTEPLRLWDGFMNSAVIVAYFSGLQDVAFDINSQLYALTSNTLSRYDMQTGLTQNYWQGTGLLYNLSDARALTWLVP